MIKGIYPLNSSYCFQILSTLLIPSPDQILFNFLITSYDHNLYYLNNTLKEVDESSQILFCLTNT